MRTAERVLVFLREFSAATPEMLYNQVRRIDWLQYLRPHMTFAVNCVISKRGAPGGPNHSHFTALKIKDGIADDLRKRAGERPDVDVEAPDVRVHAYVLGKRCRLSLDATGEGLHRRGYRQATGAAPLKESLAAALLELSGWDGESPLVDPMCGAGTILLEAAARARGLAPGLGRERFGFMGWTDFDAALWARLVAEARARARATAPGPLLGFDRDGRAVEHAREAARALGVAGDARFEVQELAACAPPAGGRPGLLLTNPPYGVRLGAEGGLEALYRQLGDVLKQRFRGWRAGLLTTPDMAKHVGLKPSRRIPLFNGPIECRLLLYELY
ncbi:MAG TPA: THUMP domain-containing protein [Myxococcota bacterium]|nr:THUMP domain-containing protein [Myxococcota bacterium]